MVKIKNHDRFVLITNEHTVSFLFKEGANRPFAVVKSGGREEIEREYINHNRAFSLFPDRVPRIHNYEKEDGAASFWIEYVQERTMGNLIASSWFKKKRRFVKETRDIFSLLVELMEKCVHQFETREDIIQQDDLDSILSVIGSYFVSKEILPDLRRCFNEIIGVKTPLIMQHGDFCVRNILYADQNRKMIIDWEDSKENHFPLVDFNMLLISLNKLHARLFKCKNDDFFQEAKIKESLLSTKRKLMNLLDLNEDDFTRISLLSTAFLCAQNLKKGRNKTASDIFRYLERKVRTPGMDAF